MCWTALWQAATVMSYPCRRPINQTAVQLCDKGNKQKCNRVEAEISFLWLRHPNNYARSDACIRTQTLFFARTHCRAPWEVKWEWHVGSMYHSVAARAAACLTKPKTEGDLMMNISLKISQGWWIPWRILGGENTEKCSSQFFNYLVCPANI